ncbi:hypothetical protein O4G98_14505 [Zoogloeaceae bacterium G21618-S1]|nr:hypothetical protein [Zoogloeaceae bacterium G21618-S1]
MELRDFVAQTLTEIAEGVVRAQETLTPIGAKVNPQMSRVFSKGEKNYEAFGWANGEGANPVLLVSFDVAVTASEGRKTKGGIGVVTGIVSLGSSGATDRNDTAVSRLSFKVPLLLPLHKSS